ncbi:CoA transferase [Frankia sp. AgB1.9]|uniref:CaiB/BaiF CoA transferase family protein n=1 Tax=unclassified Frankia TaxID=2632575 RepID=UPI00193251BD|nr:MULTISPECIES: CoA transferase [unclassified Frankia]MBL7493523.1 CoA transferase [Frankia sp. AgW1.1]MBL7552736.1 CoA transferase [Frankia sp. AgB1.9]MBL7624643.1 CoA transferase [Frankia sp. AgB1.8]
MTGPLTGVVVIELARALAGPHAGMMLGDLGARVIKVEPPGGDDTRGWGSPFVGPEDEQESTYFLSCNRNKESVTADLKSGDGRRTLTELLRRADVLIENYRPGVLARLGFPAARLDAINPRLVTLSITGFGHDGPLGHRAGYDQIAQGEAGLMSVTGPSQDQPTRVGVPIGDVLAGMYGAFGVLAALRERAATGRGTVVRTSLLAAVVGAHAFHGSGYTVAGKVPAAQGNHHPTLAPYGLFACKDGPVQIAVGSEALWRRFAPVLGVATDDPRFAGNARRIERRDELIALIEATLSTRTVEEALTALDDGGVPCGRIRTMAEVYDWEQTRSQGLLVDVEHRTLGAITLPGPPLRFDHWTAERHAAPPTLGEHDDAVRRWLATDEDPVAVAAELP